MNLESKCHEELYRTHIKAFVDAFVRKERRERWSHLLLTRPKQLYKNSHKLFDHLDKSRCAVIESSLFPLDTEGMFCDFWPESVGVMTTASRAFEIGMGYDAIYSVTPGKCAFYFFHEDIVLECRA